MSERYQAGMSMMLDESSDKGHFAQFISNKRVDEEKREDKDIEKDFQQNLETETYPLLSAPVNPTENSLAFASSLCETGLKCATNESVEQETGACLSNSIEIVVHPSSAMSSSETSATSATKELGKEDPKALEDCSQAMMMCTMTTSIYKPVDIHVAVYEKIDPKRRCLKCFNQIKDFPPVPSPTEYNPLTRKFKGYGYFHRPCAKAIALLDPAQRGERINLFTLMMMDVYNMTVEELMEMQATPDNQAFTTFEGHLDFDIWLETNPLQPGFEIVAPPFICKSLALETHITETYEFIEQKIIKGRQDKKKAALVEGNVASTPTS